jgi:hypothetical protein
MKYMLHALFNYRVIPKPVHDWYRKRCKNDAANATQRGEYKGCDEEQDNDYNSDDETHSDDISSSSSTKREESTSDDCQSNKFTSKKPSVSFKDLKCVFNKVEFERCFRVVTLAARRQSDRSMPRAAFQEWGNRPDMPNRLRVSWIMSNNSYFHERYAF